MLMGTLLLILLMGSRVQLHLLYDMLVKLTHILEAQITRTFSIKDQNSENVYAEHNSPISNECQTQ